MIIEKTVVNNKNEYVLYFCDIHGLIDFFKLNEIFISNFENIMKVHRPVDKNFKYTKIFNEDIIMYQLEKITILYQIIINPENFDIITIGRIGIKNDKNNGEFSMIHTNEKYRGQQFCKLNISNFIKNVISYEKFNTLKKISLHVRKTNIPALKCYENNGFIIVSDDKEHYLMEKNIQ